MEYPDGLDWRRMEPMADRLVEVLNEMGCSRREAVGLLSAMFLNHALSVEVPVSKMHELVDIFVAWRQERGLPDAVLVNKQESDPGPDAEMPPHMNPLTDEEIEDLGQATLHGRLPDPMVQRLMATAFEVPTLRKKVRRSEARSSS